MWAARHTQLQVEVAIKLMDSRLASSSMMRARFEREARATAQIHNNHIVHVQDCGVEGDLPFLVMEMLRGEDLGKRLRREKRLSMQEVFQILSQVGKGLRRAHDAGFVHRDLKPGNIFLAQSEGDEVVKILDFGIVKETESPVGEATKTGEFLGSPHYMSPEQVKGAKDIDARSDLWSLGVILYRAVTGELPFPGESVGLVISQIIGQPLRPPSQVAAGIPTTVDPFFLRALARNREERFQSVGEMVEAFAPLAGRRAPLPSVQISEGQGSHLGHSPVPPEVAPRPAPAQPTGDTITKPHVRQPTPVPAVAAPSKDGSDTVTKPHVRRQSQPTHGAAVPPPAYGNHAASSPPAHPAHQAYGSHATSSPPAHSPPPVYAGAAAPPSSMQPAYAGAADPMSSPLPAPPGAGAPAMPMTAAMGTMIIQDYSPPKLPSQSSTPPPSPPASQSQMGSERQEHPVFRMKTARLPTFGSDPTPASAPPSGASPPASSAPPPSSYMQGLEAPRSGGDLQGGGLGWSAIRRPLIAGLVVGLGLSVIVGLMALIVRSCSP